MRKRWGFILTNRKKLLCEGYHFPKIRPTEASKMFHISPNAKNLCFDGFLLHTFCTNDKVLRYGENNQFEFFDHPAVVKRGEKRIINIYAAVPDVA